MSRTKDERSALTDEQRLAEAEESLKHIREDYEEQIKQHAEALLLAEERLQVSQRISKSGSWERNLVTGVVWWSDELYRLHGEEPRGFEPVFESFLDKVHPEDRERVESEARAAWETTEPYVSEFRIILPDGSERWVSTSLEVGCDPDGRPRRFNGTARDITEAKELQKALEQSEARAKALLDVNPDLIFRINRDGNYVDVHASDPSRLAFPRESIIGRNVLELFDESFAAELQLHTHNALETGEVQLWQYQLPIHGDNRNLEARVIKSGTDEVIAIVQDITEQTRLEREVISIGENERKRIGHDLHDGLGQELTAISLALKALNVKLGREQSPHAATVQNLTKATQKMISETRRYARQLSPVFSSDFGLGTALQSLAAEVKEYSDARCQARCLYEDDMLDTDTAVHLYRIAQESVNNAVRHSDAKSIELEYGREGDSLYLEILDDGKGIPGKGHRIDGIGLRSMRYRARILRGRLDIAPRLHGGTRVRCSCPLPTD